MRTEFLRTESASLQSYRRFPPGRIDAVPQVHAAADSCKHPAKFSKYSMNFTEEEQISILDERNLRD